MAVKNKSGFSILLFFMPVIGKFICTHQVEYLSSRVDITLVIYMTREDIVVCFDLDDTLYKEIDYVRSGYRYVARLSALGNAEEVMLSAGRKKQNAFDAVAALDPTFDIPRAVDAFRAHFPDIVLPAGSERLLSRLKELGAVMYVITDGRIIGQTNKYEALGLERFIPRRNLIISEATGHDKHDPDNFLTVMEREGTGKRYFYIGDNPVKDFLHPNRLGWTTVMLLDTNAENTHTQTGDFPAENRAQKTVSALEDVEKLLPV